MQARSMGDLALAQGDRRGGNQALGASEFGSDRLGVASDMGNRFPHASGLLTQSRIEKGEGVDGRVGREPDQICGKRVSLGLALRQLGSHAQSQQGSEQLSFGRAFGTVLECVQRVSEGCLRLLRRNCRSLNCSERLRRGRVEFRSKIRTSERGRGQRNAADQTGERRRVRRLAELVHDLGRAVDHHVAVLLSENARNCQSVRAACHVVRTRRATN
jgi:hypothetical protein